MSYKCICGNGATLGHISGCDNKQGCKACCNGKGGVRHADMMREIFDKGKGGLAKGNISDVFVPQRKARRVYKNIKKINRNIYNL